MYACTELYDGSTLTSGPAMSCGRGKLAGDGAPTNAFAAAGSRGGGISGMQCVTEEYVAAAGGGFITTFAFNPSDGKTVIIPPTSDPGIEGALWNNGGTLTISAG